MKTYFPLLLVAVLLVPAWPPTPPASYAFSPPAAAAQDPPDVVPVPVLELEVAGDVVQMVRTLPVTITAPAGGSLYLWEFPSGVEGVKLGNKAEITALPANDSMITLQMQVINFQEQTFKLIPGTVTLRNGTTPPEPPPEPKPPTPDPDEVPADEFDNVGRLSFQQSANLSGHAAVAGEYDKCAAGLADGTYRTITQAVDDVSIPAAYSEWGSAINENLAKQWPLSKAKMIEWLNCVSNGLKAHGE